jgi:hypothetical protein
MTPYNCRRGQRLTTDAKGISADYAFLAHFQVAAVDAIAPSTAAVLATTGLNAIVQTIAANITSPATPRNVSITGSAAGIAGNVTITGTNYSGDTITETIALSGTSTVAGSKAFASITSIALPVKTNSSGDTVSVGIGSALGLPYKMVHNTVLAAYLDNTKESTAPAIAASASATESNTITLATALSGKVVDVYLIV